MTAAVVATECAADMASTLQRAADALWCSMLRAKLVCATVWLRWLQWPCKGCVMSLRKSKHCLGARAEAHGSTFSQRLTELAAEPDGAPLGCLARRKEGRSNIVVFSSYIADCRSGVARCGMPWSVPCSRCSLEKIADECMHTARIPSAILCNPAASACPFNQLSHKTLSHAVVSTHRSRRSVGSESRAALLKDAMVTCCTERFCASS